MMKKRYFVFVVTVSLTACSGEDKTYDPATDSSRSSDPADTGADPSGTSPDSQTSSGTDSHHGSATDDSDPVDTQNTSDDDTATDTETVQMYCPDGSEKHTTASGSVVCCSENFPVFCDENESGYAGSCWNDGVDCGTLTLCGGDWHACAEGSLPYCDAEENFLCYPCGDGSTPYTTASGRPVCCDSERPTFCDENDDGYQGGCWADGVDCDTITLCDGHYLACMADALPFCDESGNMTCHPCPADATRHETTSGRPVCCTTDQPTFCDENSLGYPGGCWSAAIDCSTIIPCGEAFGACGDGFESSCEDDQIICR